MIRLANMAPCTIRKEFKEFKGVQEEEPGARIQESGGAGVAKRLDDELAGFEE